MSVASIYEKMLQKPENRRVSTMRQPTPFDGHDKVAPKAKPKKEDVPNADDAFFRQVDQRMASKKSGGSTSQLVEQASANRIAKLESRIDELEELVTIMMKQQMKMMKEG